ncbi:MAG: glycine cleavage T C-terminal barrel domain-containing protein, partial [Proteiniphilum sp.]|nr:glycine cleavage T C-terminal barrel domain-containing protein [Proteiniphilum sp.]
GVENVIISNTGYTGAGGFELYFYPEEGAAIWEALFDAGADYGMKPIGLGARDTLRLEMGFCLYGNDLDDSTTPLQAGLGWITRFTDDKPFIGREVLEKEKAEGVSRRLCCFELTEKGIPRHGYEICNDEDHPIGVVTSGTISPVLKTGIGMGYLKPEYATPGTEIYISVRNKKLKAVVVKPPFRK